MKRALPLALLLLATGCMVGPNYKRPELPLPAQYAEQAPAGQAMPVPPQWWTLYHDETLDALVKEGLARNADVKLAAARVEEAEAALREARATVFVPLVQGNAGATRSRTIQFGTANTFTLGLSTSFEVDLWGRLRRAEAGVRDTLLASRYGSDTVSLTLAATNARTYFAALSLDAQVAASDEIRRAAEESLGLAKRRLDAGVGSALDVYQAGSLALSTAAQAKETARQRAATVHQLGVLTGRLDATLPTREMAAITVPALPAAGLPSELLERRPDVRQSEALLAAATERIGVARAAQFPTLTINGSLGEQSPKIENLFNAGSRVWSVGGGLLGPIIDGGRYAARTAQAEAQAKQAEATYQRTVENAYRDVADALSNVRLAADQEGDLSERVRQSREALRLAQLRYQSGYSAYLEVLDAQRTLNDALLAYLRNHQAYLSFTVDLMNALGGGWAESR
jgi:multidrug efflux system outer membrane protein